MVTSTVARAGKLSSGAAVQVGRRVSEALNLTTGLRIFQSRRRLSNAAGASLSIASARLGSALQRIVSASMRVPSSSVTPVSGSIVATGTPVASVAPASRAASAIANDTIPMPPRT